jgi:glycosyltransferase involved in cell wall biosynthesis
MLKKFKEYKKQQDQFENIIILPNNRYRKGEGGLRIKSSLKNNIKIKPLITVITVVFNESKKLEETILSVIGQSYKNIEYIIIDGGSTDDTLKVIHKYENLIDYWVSEKDNGIYDAMNKGCKLSMGRGLIFLNAGDKFVGDVFHNKQKPPFLLPCKVIDEEGKIFEKKISDVKIGIPTSHQAMVFFNKSILYDLRYEISSDYDYFIRHGVFLNLDKSCPGYVLYDNNGISKNNNWKRDFETVIILYRHFGFLKSLKFIKQQLIKLIYKKIIK